MAVFKNVDSSIQILDPLNHTSPGAQESALQQILIVICMHMEIQPLLL